MSETVIKLENIGKQYRLGTVGSLLFSNPGLVKLNFEQAKFLAELNRGNPARRFATTRAERSRSLVNNMRGKEDPALKIGQTNQLNLKSKRSNNNSNYDKNE